MTAALARIKEHLSHLYDINPFVSLLKMRIEDVREGEATLSMPVIYEIHTNLYRNAHGGALASLADTAMGVSCATLGNRVVTLDMNINYIRGAGEQPAIYCTGKVIHNGKSTMVVEAELTDGAGSLLGKARGTFFVIGKFDSAD